MKYLLSYPTFVEKLPSNEPLLPSSLSLLCHVFNLEPHFQSSNGHCMNWVNKIVKRHCNTAKNRIQNHHLSTQITAQTSIQILSQPAY